MSAQTHDLPDAAIPVQAGPADLDPLFERLLTVAPEDHAAIERRIWQEFAKSGSPAMDLLLERGESALQSEDYGGAIEHLTALTDHAPGFAQGFHLRATAYYNLGRYGPALADIERALALEPRHFAAMEGLGVILEELGYKEDALEVFMRVRAIHPHCKDLSQRIEMLQRQTVGRRL
ncbi:MAG: tetratricopeptide repeat protein [Pseudomonadota bacterium]